MVIQNYVNFETSSFVVHFTVDQAGILFGSQGTTFKVVRNKKIENVLLPSMIERFYEPFLTFL